MPVDTAEREKTSCHRKNHFASPKVARHILHICNHQYLLWQV